MKDDDYQDVPTTLAVALAFWAGAVAAGTQAGIFLRLPGAVYAALAAFAIAFALGVVTMDARVRGWLDRRGAQAARLALLATAGLMAAAGLELAGTREADFAAAPWAPVILFGVPVTLALAVAAIGARLRQPARTARRPQRVGGRAVSCG